MTNAQNYVQALEEEREGYERRGDEKRVAEVNEQLAIWRKKAAAEKREQAATARSEEYLDDVDEPTPSPFRLPGADPNAQRVVPSPDAPSFSIEELATALRDEVLPGLLAPLENRIRELESKFTEDHPSESTPDDAPSTPKDNDVFTLPDDKAPVADDTSDSTEARKAAGESTTTGGEPADAPQQATPAKKPRQTR